MTIIKQYPTLNPPHAKANIILLRIEITSSTKGAHALTLVTPSMIY